MESIAFPMLKERRGKRKKVKNSCSRLFRNKMILFE